MFTIVHPDLLHFNGGLFRFVSVGQRGQRSACGCTCQGISNHIRLLPGVYDILTVLAFRQLIDLSYPVVVRIQVHRFTSRFTVRQKLNRQSGRPQSVTVVFVLPELLHSDACQNPRIHELSSAAFNCDRSFTVRRSYSIVSTFSFFHGIFDIRRQPCCCRSLAILQFERRYTVNECHIAISFVYGGIAERHREFKLLVRVCANTALHGLADFQVANFSGIGEISDALIFFIDRPTGALSFCCKLLVFCFLDTEVSSNRQACCCCVFTVLEFDSRLTINECHVPISSVHGLITQHNCEFKYLFFIGCRIAYKCLADGQITCLSGVRKRSRTASFNDCTFAILRFSYETNIFCLSYFIGDSNRQFLRSLSFAALQFDGSHTVLEGHLSICSVDCLVIQFDSKLERLGFIGCCITYNCLANSQVSSLSGVRKRCYASSFYDCAFIVFRLGCEVIIYGFGYLIGNSYWQFLRSLFLASSQFKGGDTVLKGHFTICSIDGLVIQFDCKLERLSLIGRCITYNCLANNQVTDFSGIRKHNCASSFNDCTFVIFGLGCEVIIYNLGYLIGDSCRQFFRCLIFATYKFKCSNTVLEGHLTICSIYCLVTQFDSKLELLSLIGRCITYNCLANS